MLFIYNILIMANIFCIFRMLRKYLWNITLHVVEHITKEHFDLTSIGTCPHSGHINWAHLKNCNFKRSVFLSKLQTNRWKRLFFTAIVLFAALQLRHQAIQSRTTFNITQPPDYLKTHGTKIDMPVNVASKELAVLLHSRRIPFLKTTYPTGLIRLQP